MSARRTALAAVTAWLAVVAIGSTLVWAVISRAGEGLTPAADPALPGRTGQVSTPRLPQGTSRENENPTSSGRASDDAAGTPSGPASPSLPSASAPPPTTAVAAQRRSWQGPGGFVAAECRGTAISLVAAQADSGFAVQVESRGPQQVNVHFTGQGEEGRQAEVQAGCRGGVPAFQVQESD